ncbi:cysteine--tRNA ligase [Jiella pacifica]|uniref:Cysteine--tRNA ligase n=1 Tax=Jiella pacifica TaxID=2696469 RepID=A0A6N9T5K5_9HYPH|nr:cysteine--tRNA ligase [Jiella pacifica]NDW06653.1 cysteine--tRNA ligase [Jiella pacifica]
MSEDDGFLGLKLYNTMTRTKEDFRPLDWRSGAIAEKDRRVRMYVCGPTAYDYAHIGNARPVIVFDVLFRLLRHLYGADHVVYARNITDVDDKINARAARDYPGVPLNEAIGRLTAWTAEQFHADVAALGCLEPTFEPRATAYVSRDDGHDMISMITALIEKGHAYQAGGEVLFDVTSMADYGRLSNRKLDDQKAGARVAVDAHKKNPADFVLWKLSSPEEPGWDSPWGRGRPGWHLECSVMSEALLGETFDIHGGGLDLIFPHHENEIAQSRCAHGSGTMAEVWMHNGFLQVEGRKMAKSEGNFVTIRELLETEKFGGRKWPGDVLRLAMLMTHYREPIDFSVRRLEEAEAVLARWRRVATDEGATSGSEFSSEFVTALCDDLDTARAMQILHRHFNLGRWAEDPMLRHEKEAVFGFDNSSSGFTDPAQRKAAASIGLSCLNLVGIKLNTSNELEEGEMAQIAKRLAFIRDKNWAEADRIRDELLEKGIQLKDGKDAATGERTTTWEVKR